MLDEFGQGDRMPSCRISGLPPFLADVRVPPSLGGSGRETMALFSSNFRFALRQLKRSPGFAVTAILTLALAIGANTAIFTLLNQALLRALPVKSPGQLAVLSFSGSS